MLSVAGDNLATYQIPCSSTGSQTFSFTCSGNLRLLVVGVISNIAQPTSMSYAGVPLTKLTGGGSAPIAAIWGLVNPALGANNLVVGWSGGLPARLIFRSYCNVHPLTPFGTAQFTTA